MDCFAKKVLSANLIGKKIHVHGQKKYSKSTLCLKIKCFCRKHLMQKSKKIYKYNYPSKLHNQINDQGTKYPK